MSKAVASRKMVLNRTHTLTSLSGHSIRFVKGEPTHVPPSMYGEALAIGAEFHDGKGLPEPVVTPDNTPVDPSVRAEKVLAAILVLVARNNNLEFTAAGLPKVTAVSKEAGFEVTTRDIASAWQAYHDAKAAEALG